MLHLTALGVGQCCYDVLVVYLLFVGLALHLTTPYVSLCCRMCLVVYHLAAAMALIVLPILVHHEYAGQCFKICFVRLFIISLSPLKSLRNN